MNDKERIAELEAELTMRREQAEGLQNQWAKDTQKIVALEAEVKTLRKDAERWNRLPAYLEKYQINYVGLLADIDSDLTAQGRRNETN